MIYFVVMATGTDFKNLWERFQKEGVPAKISIARFCQMNGVVYSHFEKWYKRTYTEGVIPVEVVDPSSLPESKAELKPSTRIKHLEVMFSNGLLVKFLGDFFGDMVTGGKKHLKILSLSTT